jgi:beta-lactamase class A
MSFKPAGWLNLAGSTSFVYQIEVGYRGARSWRHYLRWIRLMATMILVFMGGIGLSALRSPSHNQALASQPAYPQITQTAPVEYKSSPKTSQALEAQIESWTAKHSSQQWGIVVQQLSSGNVSVNYRAMTPFYPASIYKLLLVQSLISKYPYQNWNKTLSSTGTTLSDCMDRMIRYSDNDCGMALGNMVGWSYANAQLKKAGLTGTDIANIDSKLHTTAGDVDLYLNEFYNSPDSPAKQSILNAMGQQIYRSGIPASSPNCKVYDKIGDLNGYKHDAAIVVCPNTTYSLVVMSQGGSYAQIADVAKLVNDYLAN